ncbi:MAG TPA: hypothetical protein VEW46_13355 [Pyrinomonadaceae bacterium]|nr:hypothetical protein [Pyrinomonadaceae bacterium]
MLVDETKNASDTLAVDLGIQLRERNTLRGISVEFRITSQSFRNTLVFI